MAVQDQIQRLRTRFKGKTNQVFFGALIAILVIRLLFFAGENSLDIGEPAEPTVQPLVPSLTEDSEVYKRVRSMLEPMTDFKDSDFQKLGEGNMFDAKQVLDAKAIEQRAQETFREAVNAQAQGDARKALGLFDEVLKMQPNHANARERRDQIRAELGLGAEEPGVGEQPLLLEEGATTTTEGTPAPAPVPETSPTAPPGAP